jgi:hypothetical protein
MITGNKDSIIVVHNYFPKGKSHPKISMPLKINRDTFGLSHGEGVLIS